MAVAVRCLVRTLCKGLEPMWDEVGGRDGEITFPNLNPLMAA